MNSSPHPYTKTPFLSPFDWAATNLSQWQAFVHAVPSTWAPFLPQFQLPKFSSATRLCSGKWELSSMLPKKRHCASQLTGLTKFPGHYCPVQRVCSGCVSSHCHGSHLLTQFISLPNEPVSSLRAEIFLCSAAPEPREEPDAVQALPMWGEWMGEAFLDGNPFFRTAEWLGEQENASIPGLRVYRRPVIIFC